MQFTYYDYKKLISDMTSLGNEIGGIDVSIILPVYNAEKWLNECLLSIYSQSFMGRLEVCIYNDSSTDLSAEIIYKWLAKFQSKSINVELSGSMSQELDDKSLGAGAAKNRAVSTSHGTHLCFQDADDVMKKNRVQRQWEEAMKLSNDYIVGCKFVRSPEGSSIRFSRWANNLTADQLYHQRFLSHGPTIIMPTWFCHRDVYDRVGGFVEMGKGCPEDLHFFYRHLQLDFKLHRVEEVLLTYRYHEDATTFSVLEESIWQLRVSEIQSQLLVKWQHFSIWSAGKQGKKFYRSLTASNRAKVSCFCDVDKNKIDKGWYTFEMAEELPKPKVPIVHFTNVKPPIVICIKLDLLVGGFEQNLASLQLTEGKDYFHFN